MKNYLRILRVASLNIVLSVLVVAFVAFLLKIDRSWLSPLPVFTRIVAWPFLVGGVFLIVSAVLALLKHGGATGAPGDSTRKLVIAGPYQWIRNPIYAGGTLLLFGLAFYTRSLLLFLMTNVFMAGMHFVVSLIEEPGAEKRFGDEYQKYKQEVPRWFPRLSKRNSKKEANEQ
ncbi:MAG: isoprenylcysteine carboxylmethyltransferase family protein [Chloroflexota bacterium]